MLLSRHFIINFEGGKETFTTGDEIVKSRKYDLSITYDNFYKTPRIWLFGFDENGSVLRQEQLFEDIMGGKNA